MLENLRLAFRGIWSHKMRSFLTMLGIIIGIAAIIAIVSTIQGTNEQIKKNLVGSGTSVVDVKLMKDDYQYETEYYGLPEGVPQITENELEQIRAIPHVQDAATYLSRNVYNVARLSYTMSGYVKGVDSSYLNVCNYIMREGRNISQADLDESRKVAILDEAAEEALFNGEKAIGQTIEIAGEPYVVIGIAVEANAYEPVINSLSDYYTYAYSYGGNIYIPETTWPIVYSYDEPQNVVIKTDSVDNMTEVGKKASEIMSAYITNTNGNITYKANDLMEQAKQIQQLSSSTNMMLIWIAGISLLVGGIGVMNIMLVSVTERTSEIGLKKAIGARKGKILRQFLTEAAVLTSMGGILGVIVGVILAKVISSISETPVAISVPASIGAVVFSMVIGIVFGLLPSYKAANLDPIEALRHE